MAESNSRYHLLPHPIDELSDHEDSPRASLLPTSSFSINTMKFPKTYTITINPVLILRLISTILALTAFIIFVIDGGDAFIAADIFLMSIIIVNVLMIIHYFVSNVLKVTVELRHQPVQIGRSKNSFKVSTYFDVGLSIVLIICLLIGNAVASHSYWGSAWKAAVIVGYFVVLLQVSLAVPILNQKSLTLTAKLNDLKGKPTPDAKVPAMVDNAERGSARRRTIEGQGEERRQQSAEDLV